MNIRTTMWLAPMLVQLACNGGTTSATSSAEGTGGQATGPHETTGAATTAAETSAATTQSSAEATHSSTVADTSSAVDSNADEGHIFDVGFLPDITVNCGSGGKGGGGGSTDFSYIWIANSNQSTVSKINTETLIEEGRYITRPDSAGNPSRTSVNLNGDMAIANRNGGVTMIYARHENCPDPTNTSSGPFDVKPWQDGCVGWYTPMNYISQRPVAWTAGVWSDANCRFNDTKLWTSGANDPLVDVLLLDGETGAIEQTVPLLGVTVSYYGIYGGAVDGEDNFWGGQLGIGHVVRVDFDDFTQEIFPMPVNGYGVAVDPNGRVWTCSYEVGRFDYIAGTWQTAMAGGSGGCMPDGNDLIWLANDPLVAVDIETLAVVQTLDVPNYVHGVSIDFDGYVWGPAIYNNEAYRVDPMTGMVDTVVGLDYPYTYSDMTGFGLSQAGTPSG